MHVIDRTKAYMPESQIIFDIPTAYAFFGEKPEDTLKTVRTAVHSLVQGWNEEYVTKKNKVNRKRA